MGRPRGSKNKPRKKVKAKKVEKPITSTERQESNAAKARVWLDAEKQYRYHNDRYSPSIRMIHNCKRWARLGITYLSGTHDRTGSPKILPIETIENAVAKERALCISVLPDDERAVYTIVDERFAAAEKKKAERLANDKKREDAKKKEKEKRNITNRITSTGGAGLDLEDCEVPEGGVPDVPEKVQGDPTPSEGMDWGKVS